MKNLFMRIALSKTTIKLKILSMWHEITGHNVHLEIPGSDMSQCIVCYQMPTFFLFQLVCFSLNLTGNNIPLKSMQRDMIQGSSRNRIRYSSLSTILDINFYCCRDTFLVPKSKMYGILVQWAQYNKFVDNRSKN